MINYFEKGKTVEVEKQNDNSFYLLFKNLAPRIFLDRQRKKQQHLNTLNEDQEMQRNDHRS